MISKTTVDKSWFYHLINSEFSLKYNITSETLFLLDSRSNKILLEIICPFRIEKIKYDSTMEEADIYIEGWNDNEWKWFKLNILKEG